MDDTNNIRGNLHPVSIELLFEGMNVQEDIYDADAAMLIAKQGTMLGKGDIEMIKSLNTGREIIYVSSSTQKILMERRPKLENLSIREVEETTGYTEIKDDTFTLLDEIAATKTVKQEDLLSISASLSNRLEVTSPSVILSLINALAPVDEYLQRHCVNVGLLNGLFGQWIGLNKNEVDKLVLVGLLHDCGKAMVPPTVLNSPRKLTIVEFEVIKMHPVFSYELLKDFPEPVRRAARCHHEKVNGRGYPDRYERDNIPMEARITAISDIYDAMVSQRAYKNGKSPFSTMAMLQRLSETDVDSRLVSIFIKSMPCELIDKAVVMSDGSIGIVKAFYPDDIEHPAIDIDGHIIKSNDSLYCSSMYNAE